MASSFRAGVCKWPAETPFGALDEEGNVGRCPRKKGSGSRTWSALPVLTATRDWKMELIKGLRVTASSFTARFPVYWVLEET